MDPFLQACSRNDVNCVKAFLARTHTAINTTDDKARTGLHYAARKGCKEVVLLLLEHPLDLHKQDQDGMSPLHHAMLYFASKDVNTEKFAGVVLALLEDGANPLLMDKVADKKGSCSTPLKLAKSLLPPGPLKDKILDALEQAGKKFAPPPVGGAASPSRNLGASSRSLGSPRPPLPSSSSDELSLFHQRCLAADLDAVAAQAFASPGLVLKADSEGSTALHFTARSGSVAVMSALLEGRAGPEVLSAATTAEGRTPLILAIQGGHVELAAFLLASGADASQRDAGGLNALHHAVLSKRTALLQEVLNALVQDGAPSSVLDGMLVAQGKAQGLTPLGLAQEGQSKGMPPEMVALLRAAGAESFLLACRLGDAERVQASLAKDPSLSAACRDPVSASTPLMNAALSGSEPCLDALLAADAPVDAVEGAGRTALMLAARAGKPGCIRVLLHADASASPVDEEGLSALHHAAKCLEGAQVAAEAVRELLRTSKALDKSAKCAKGKTALDYAKALRHVGMHASDDCIRALQE